jgi:NADP-dependent 3-hydroxy acid dehydrogenase YdfG
MVEWGAWPVINMGSIAVTTPIPEAVGIVLQSCCQGLSDGLRIDLVDTPLRVTNIKRGLVETNFSVVRFRGNKEAADKVYSGIVHSMATM